MTEDFNRVTAFDFSKMSDKDIAMAQSIIAQLFPNFSDVIEKLNDARRNQITLEDVLTAMQNNMADPEHFMNIHAVRTACRLLNRIYPGAVFSLVLRTIALEMDKQYANHISDCPIVYIHSNLDGRIHEIESKNVTRNRWKYFAAFRSQQEAITAVKLTQKVRHALLEQED